MQRVVTAAEMRAVDQAAERFGMPASVLMENAGDALAQAALKMASATGHFWVLCGVGNNGGDGFVAARKLVSQGRQVSVELVGAIDGLQGESKRNLEALTAAGVDIHFDESAQPGPGDVVIDALFGTGLSRVPAGRFGKAIERINSWARAGARIVSADLPSGLHSDTGAPFEPCVNAHATLSFGFLKLGQVLQPGASRCGALECVDIGIPKAAHVALLGPPIWLLEEADIIARIPARVLQSHKGTYGHVLVIAGSKGKSGAAALASLAALRAGAGLVSVATRPDTLAQVMSFSPELMGVELNAEGALGTSDLNPLLEAGEGKQALVIGPGIHRGEDTAALITSLVEELNIPVVLDADALNAFAGKLRLLKTISDKVVVTPHPGEMARLLETTSSAVNETRIDGTRTFAVEHQITAILKGARTVIASKDGSVFVNPTGNPGMATAGTGDVLSGMIGGLLAQGLTPIDASIAGVYAHGLAGDLMTSKRGQQGLIASDLLEGLGDVWVRWAR